MAKKVLMATVALLALFMMIPQGLACFYFRPAIVRPAIVSTDLLEWNLNCGNLVVVDVRGEDAYNAGHIPGAINVPEGMWYINPPFGLDLPWMEMPPKDYLFDLIGDAGITRHSWVVVVGATSGPLTVPEVPPLAFYSTAGITRVAITLLYAGVKYVSILDGGYDKWAMEGKPVSTDAVAPIPVTYKGPVDKTMLVSADYVESKIGKSIIVDARDEIVYDGTVTEPWAPDPGHISTARNLPTPTLWNVEVDGDFAVYITYKDMWTLWSMVSSVVGWSGRGREIIVYCGVGGYASTAYFVLSEVLGYRNVRIYDGSTQEWNGMLGKPLVT